MLNSTLIDSAVAVVCVCAVLEQNKVGDSCVNTYHQLCQFDLKL